MATTYNKSNKDTRKFYHKLCTVRKLDTAMSELRRGGVVFPSLRDIAKQSGLSYRTALRYIDKETLKILHKGVINLASLLYD
jgi:hypothetical protein